MMQEKECTDIWRKYQAGKDHHNKANMYTLTEKCHRFYVATSGTGCSPEMRNYRC